jgi:hypothetical protein
MNIDDRTIIPDTRPIRRESNGWALRLCAICLISLSLYVTYGTFLDGSTVNPILKYWEGCFGMTKSVYHPGDILHVKMYANKYRELTGHIQWSLYNIDTKNVIYFAPRNTTMPSGYIDGMKAEIGVVPLYAPPGHYRLMGIVVYSPNQLRDITYSFTSDDFHIEAAKDAQ